MMKTSKTAVLSTFVLISLFWFAASAAAQTEVPAGRWKTPQQWFHDQRAYPLGFIPAGPRAKAFRQSDAISAGQNHGNDPQWKPIGPMPTQYPTGGSIDNYVTFPIRASGKIDALAVDPRDPNVLYLGSSDGGVWKTIDGGTHWAPLFDQQDSLSIGSIALDPQDPDTIYVGTGAEYESFLSIGVYGDGIYKSTNGGQSWRHFDASIFGVPLSTYNGDGGARVVSLAVSPQDKKVVLAGVKFSDFSPLPGSGIWRSSDGGARWDLVLAGDFGGQVLFDPTDGNTAYAVLNTTFGAVTAGPDGVYKSTDGGITWKPILSYSANYIALAIAPSNPQTLYALTVDPAVIKSTDGGRTWSAPLYNSGFCGDQCAYDQVIAVDPVDPNIVFIGGELYIHRSLDGGATWTKVDGRIIHVDHHALAFSADGTVLYDGNDGGVWRTTDISKAARKIARTCRDWASSKGGTASIYILDTHGTFVHQERGDGQVYTNIHTAMLKAQTALQTRQPTSICNAQLRNDPSGNPRQLVQFGFFTNSGGIPIVVDGEMIGAIGVGGGAGTGGDENCAIEGLKAAFGNRVLLPVYPPQK
jgi:uncharacterized protein GlcG (DUF336 family)